MNSKGKKIEKKRLIGALMILPAIGLIAALVLYPVLYGIWISLFRKHIFLPGQTYIGLHNYIYLLHDSEFWKSFNFGLYYSATTVLVQIILGLMVALLLNETFKGRGILRGIVLFPYVIPTIVAVVLWRWLLNESFGLVDYVLSVMGIIKEPIIWLGTDHVMDSIIIVSIWKFFPFVVIGLLARLQTIPLELYEAAEVDGATTWQKFMHVTLPQLTNVMFVVILLRGIWMFTKFDVIWLMTSGGSQYVRTLPVYTYMRTFNYQQVGMGASMGILMFLMLVVAAAIYFKLFRRFEET